MKRLFLSAIPIVVSTFTMAIADVRIYDTKDICGRYFASEISGNDAAKVMGLTRTGRTNAKVEQYCNFFR